MKALPFSNLQIDVAAPEKSALELQRLVRESADEKLRPNDDSISSELSIDFLSKDRSGGTNDDSKLLSSLEYSSGACRWNPDDSDYSLNVLLAPQRATEGEGIETDGNDDDQDKYVDGNHDTVVAATLSIPLSTSTTHIVADSLSASSNHSLFGSDYSLNRARLRVYPNKSKSSSSHKNYVLLDTSSHHSSASSVDTTFSWRSNSEAMSLPENIEVVHDHQQQQTCLQRLLPKTKAMRTSSVSFYPRVRIQRVTPRKMIPPEQVGDVWYSRDEFHVIRQECFKTIRLMKNDEDANDEDFPLFDEDGVELCRRGLEYKTPKAYKRRQKQKKDVRMVVFDELDFQQEQGMDDPLWLAKLSRDQSRACVEAAIQSAREDERQARSYLKCD
jgi:hypothetical protein